MNACFRSYRAAYTVFLEYYDGTSWVVLKQYFPGIDFVLDAATTDEVVMDPGSYTFTTDAKIRFRTDTDTKYERFFVDNVAIEGFVQLIR